MEAVFNAIYRLIEFASGQEIAQSVNNISDETKLAFLSILERVEYPKGTVLSVPGRSTEEVYIIESGLMTTSLLIDGKEVGAGFYAEGGIGGDIISFLTRRPSTRTVKTLEPSTLWVLKRRDLEKLYENNHEAEHIGRLLYNYVVIVQQQRIEDMVLETASVRYKKLQDRFPNIVHRLPLSFIASFLGMSQETLSRVRAQS